MSIFVFAVGWRALCAFAHRNLEDCLATCDVFSGENSTPAFLSERRGDPEESAAFVFNRCDKLWILHRSEGGLIPSYEITAL